MKPFWFPLRSPGAAMPGFECHVPPDTERTLEIPELAADTIRDLGALLMEVEDAAA